MVLKIDQVFNFPTALRKGLSSKHKTRTPARLCKYVSLILFKLLHESNKFPEYSVMTLYMPQTHISQQIDWPEKPWFGS